MLKGYNFILGGKSWGISIFENYLDDCHEQPWVGTNGLERPTQFSDEEIEIQQICLHQLLFPLPVNSCSLAIPV